MIILYIVTAIAFAAVLFTLGMGAISMGGKTPDAKAKSNMWMRRRVWAQAVALICLAALFYIRRTSGG